MPIVAALRGLLEHGVEVMIVDGEPGLRVIALTWQGDATGPAAERSVSSDAGDTGLLGALNELAAELC